MEDESQDWRPPCSPEERRGPTRSRLEVVSKRVEGLDRGRVRRGRPDGRRKAVLGVVHLLEGFLVRGDLDHPQKDVRSSPCFRGSDGKTYFHNANDGPKRLLRHDVHRVVNVDKDLRRDVRAALLGERELGLVDQRLGAGLDGGGNLGADSGSRGDTE